MQVVKRCLVVTLLLMAGFRIYAQTSVKGKVTDAGTGEALITAQVVLNDKITQGTDSKGNFRFDNLKAGDYVVKVSFLGYKPYQKNIVLKENQVLTLNISMETAVVQMGELVVTANRYEENIQKVPVRMHVITQRELSLQVSNSADEMLNYLPGVNISRSFGIFSSKSTVSMRGLGTNEQSRVLVLVDGVPVNKADGGSVNWNVINPEMVERIEVVKGPNSSIYGGNAMGGTINLITKKPVKPLSVRASLEYGTYETFSGNLMLSGKALQKGERYFYWTYGGLYRKSDGYITQSEADQQANPYITKSNVEENSNILKLGYQLSAKESIEVSATRYEGSRGTGEVVYQEDGNTTDHDIWQFMGRYNRAHNNYQSNLSLYYNTEDYRKVNEYKKDDYTFYKVLSTRSDKGGMYNYTWTGLKKHKLIGGFDMRMGSVDAYDKYYTSTDIVYNEGKLNTYGIFIQDEYIIKSDKLKLVAGLRYDNAHFMDGSFTIDAPTGETEFMNNKKYIIDGFDGDSWSDLSPRLSFQYNPSSNLRNYIQYSHGFRAPILDDMCRSGRMRGGFKIINPDLKPERLDNIEIGSDYYLSGNYKFGLSIFYSIGNDFQYYVGTGDSIDMGYGLKPIFIRDNISKVQIAGAEFSSSIHILKGLDVDFSYAYNVSKILDYTRLFEEDQLDLTGKYLSEVPVHTASLYIRYVNPFVNFGLGMKYNGKRYVNDQNTIDEIVMSDQYPDYITIDAKITKDIKHMFVGLNVQNVTDELFYDSKGAVCPGRFITGEIGYRF